MRFALLILSNVKLYYCKTLILFHFVMNLIKVNTRPISGTKLFEAPFYLKQHSIWGTVLFEATLCLRQWSIWGTILFEAQYYLKHTLFKMTYCLPDPLFKKTYCLADPLFKTTVCLKRRTNNFLLNFSKLTYYLKRCNIKQP